MVGRDGLIHITDDCFQLFLAIETATHQEFYLRKTPRMDDMFCQHVTNIVTNDNDILLSRTRITGGKQIIKKSCTNWGLLLEDIHLPKLLWNTTVKIQKENC